MGEVYSAHDEELGRKAAVKILCAEVSTDSGRKTRFKQEARAISALNHPNIVTIYEIGENDSGSYLVTELIEGKTLRDVISEEPLTILRILKITEQTANALVAAHNAHIVHRDVKPENIMVRADGIVKILDFGLAKPTIEGNTNDQAKTIPGIVMGSVRYMSPEQARGVKTDERTDIWSLGVVLYEMLTGKVPFDGVTTSDTIAEVIYKEPKSLGDVVRNAPTELQRIVRRALQKNPDERYQNIKDFALDIRALIHDLEHSTSGDHSKTLSHEGINENPTIIHQTISGANNTLAAPNHRADTIPGTPAPKSLLKMAMLPLVALLLVGAGIFAYQRFGGGGRMGSSSFERSFSQRVNTDGKVRLPAISPDGKTIAYVAGEAGSRSLVVRQLSNDAMATIVPPANLDYREVIFSPGGDYVYYTLLSQDFAFNTLYRVPTLGGESKKLIEDVDSVPAFSSDGKKFAFRRHVSSPNDDDIVFIVDTESLKLEELLKAKSSGIGGFGASIAWSPDGEKIIISTMPSPDPAQAALKTGEIDIKTKSFRLIGANWAAINDMQWFKDGSGLLLAARDLKNNPSKVWRMSYPDGEIFPVTNDSNDYVSVGLAADGKTAVSLKSDTLSSTWKFNPASKELVQLTADSRSLEGSNGISQMPDGRLVFTKTEGKRSTLWASDADGKNQRPLVTDNKNWIYRPSVDKDGKYIVYGQWLENESSEVWRVDADGKNPILLQSEGHDPTITADGKSIIFVKRPMDNSTAKVMIMPIEGGEPRDFYSDKEMLPYMTTLSPDGQKLAVVLYEVKNMSQNLKIFNLGKDGAFTEVLKVPSTFAGAAIWSPDSKSLVGASSRSGASNMWKLPIDGSEMQQITDFKSGTVLRYNWSHDGKNLFVVRGIANNDLVILKDASLGNTTASAN